MICGNPTPGAPQLALTLVAAGEPRLRLDGACDAPPLGSDWRILFNGLRRTEDIETLLGTTLGTQ